MGHINSFQLSQFKSTNIDLCLLQFCVCELPERKVTLFNKVSICCHYLRLQQASGLDMI